MACQWSAGPTTLRAVLLASVFAWCLSAKNSDPSSAAPLSNDGTLHQTKAARSLPPSLRDGCRVPVNGGIIDLSMIDEGETVRGKLAVPGGTRDILIVPSFCFAIDEPPAGKNKCGNSYLSAWWGGMVTNIDCFCGFPYLISAWQWVADGAAAGGGYVTAKFNNDIESEATVKIYCGTGDLDSIPPSSGGLDPAVKAYFSFAFSSKYACPPGSPGAPPESGGLTSGGIFVLVFFLVIGLYVGGTVAYNFKIKGLRGKELLPHPQVWGAIPGLVKDGCVFFVQKIRTLIGGGANTSYAAV
jgi:hypothetical protein